MADADAVVRSGADALGLNFAAVSARRVPVGDAAAIARSVAGSVTRVGIFVDPAPDEVRRVLDSVELDVLQFHGDEPDSFCAVFGLPYMKAHRISSAVDAVALARDFAGACCHLLDAYVPDQHGGTGRTFDWRFWPRGSDLRLVLAGGLTPENVADAIRATRPYGVDVSGGVEAGTRGLKDPERIRCFVAAVRETDGEM